MSMLYTNIKKFVKKTREVGLSRAITIARVFLQSGRAVKEGASRNPDACTFADVVYINGCDYSLPHPIRYRVDHQLQQLESNGISTLRVDAWDLTDDYLGMGRCFVIYRCPITEPIRAFIKKAQSLHKKVIFDIDDLVVDTKYTDKNEYVAAMSESEKQLYDDGVNRMGATLKECGSAITTTNVLARELATLVPEVFVNRNTASEEMYDYSNRALYERDVLPYLDVNKINPAEKKHWEHAREKADNRAKQGRTVIGYFSGSITHNEDFEMVLPALKAVLQERPNVCLRVFGLLDIPEELQSYSGQIETFEFCDWQQLPKLIADVDINIAPLTNNVFNEAKSENKWVEASLVKVPTVASNIGAFADMIEDGKTGFLCSDEASWHDVLLQLVDSPEKRREIGESAHAFCKENCTTILSGYGLAEYLKEKMAPNVFLLLPDLNISGGGIVALRHGCFLQDAGYDVSIVPDGNKENVKLFEFDGHTFPVIQARSENNEDIKILLRGHVDIAIATMWTTTLLFDDYGKIDKKNYLVQGFETDFYPPPEFRRLFANATYNRYDTQYVTVSKWCQSWLENKFHKDVVFIPNGIDTNVFSACEREFCEREKIRVLIEGNSDSPYKNVDEAFRIVDKLDPDKYEIWYVSYNSEPKHSYRIDKYFHKLTQQEMADVYRQCHILLKTSIMESFSLPPLEMMSTGGYVVVALNDGNAEYLRDGENCLIYELGNYEDAASKIEEISENKELRKRLREGARKTAQSRDWETFRERIIDVYK